MPDKQLTAGRSLIRAALDIVADYWTILIFRELYIGARQWSDLTSWLSIPPATLNERLKQLVKVGCLTRQRIVGSRVLAYELTERGIDLFPFQMAAREWQLRWHAREGAFVTPWVHECGLPLRCHTVCHACGKEPGPAEIRLVERSATLYDTSTAPRARRLSSVRETDGRSRGMQAPRVVEVWGDRCATTVMAALLRGFQKFDEIESWTGLPPATVAQRLRKLQILGLVHTRLYQQRPDRYEYCPSPSGWDSLAATLQLYRWAEKWLARTSRTFATHTVCGQPLVADLLCQSCQGLVCLSNTHVDPQGLKKVQ